MKVMGNQAADQGNLESILNSNKSLENRAFNLTKFLVQIPDTSWMSSNQIRSASKIMIDYYRVDRLYMNNISQDCLEMLYHHHMYWASKINEGKLPNLLFSLLAYSATIARVIFNKKQNTLPRTDVETYSEWLKKAYGNRFNAARMSWEILSKNNGAIMYGLSGDDAKELAKIYHNNHQQSKSREYAEKAVSHYKVWLECNRTINHEKTRQTRQIYEENIKYLEEVILKPMRLMRV